MVEEEVKLQLLRNVPQKLELLRTPCKSWSFYLRQRWLGAKAPCQWAVTCNLIL